MYVYIHMCLNFLHIQTMLLLFWLFLFWLVKCITAMQSIKANEIQFLLEKEFHLLFCNAKGDYLYLQNFILTQRMFPFCLFSWEYEKLQIYGWRKGFFIHNLLRQVLRTELGFPTNNECGEFVLLSFGEQTSQTIVVNN